jgi:DNA polymerase-1
VKKEIYIIDGSAYIYRAYHAIAPLSNSAGLATNAVLGFVNMVTRLRKERQPDYLAIAFDSKGPVFRHQLYDRYKANRPPMPEDLQQQIPYIKKFVEAANILTLETQGVEADDIIASIVRSFTSKGHRVIIVSGDKDLLQLVTDDVVMFDPMKDQDMSPADVQKKYGVTVEQLLDFFALVGDSADNIPGIPGVGPKTAEKLIGTFGSLEGLYERVEEMKKSKMKEKIIASREQAFLSRDLIALKADVEVPGELSAYKVEEGASDKLVALYTELEFSSLLKNVDTSSKIATDGFSTIRTTEQLEKLKAELDSAALLVVDTETTSLNPRKAELVGISLATSLEKAWYIPIGHLEQDGTAVAEQLSVKQVLEFLQPYLQSPELLKIAHNLKYDYTVLKKGYGLQLQGRMADTLIAAYLSESGGRSLKLDDLCLEKGLRLTPFSEVVDGDTRENCFAYVAIEKACEYSCEDVYGTLVLWQDLEPLLSEKGVADLFWNVEMKVVTLLAEMEITGISIDLDVLSVLRDEFTAKLMSLRQEIYQHAGHEFNINSPRQLGTVLFEELQLPHGRKTKTGFSTDVKVLEKLAVKHKLPALILQYRSIAKLLSTYVEKLSLLKDKETGRIHSSFNQAVTATGRLSSSDPNMQNIPIRTEEGNRIRMAFVPGDGLVFLSADYSQIDLRVLAEYSKDRALVDAFTAGDDIHTRTAAEIFSLSPLMVNSEMRRVAKSINFGIVYGMSAFGLSSQLDISRKDAQRFIDRYFDLYGGVKDFMQDIVEKTRELGYVTTLLGRRRTVPNIRAKNRNLREFAERMAINTPIQGTAADIIKLAMIDCQRVIDDHKLQVAMLLQIHDELVFELPESELPKAKPLLKEAMEGAMKISVPLVANLEVGKSLAK